MPVAHEGLYIGIRDSYILKMKAFWVVIGMLGTSFVSQGTSISKKMLPFWGDTSWRRDAPTRCVLRSLVTQRMFQKDGMQGGCFLKDSFPCQLKNVKLVYVSISHDSTSRAARGGGGSFKNRKCIGEIGCCETRMTKRKH